MSQYKLSALSPTIHDVNPPPRAGRVAAGVGRPALRTSDHGMWPAEESGIIWARRVSSTPIHRQQPSSVSAGSVWMRALASIPASITAARSRCGLHEVRGPSEWVAFLQHRETRQPERDEIASLQTLPMNSSSEASIPYRDNHSVHGRGWRLAPRSRRLPRRSLRRSHPLASPHQKLGRRTGRGP